LPFHSDITQTSLQ